MGEVIQFPGHGEAGVKKALAYIRMAYTEAGMSEPQIQAAMSEFEPTLRSFLIRREFEFILHGNFDDAQITAISDQIWLALCHIAALIGRNARMP